MFNRSNDKSVVNYVTREEAQQALAGYVTREDGQAALDRAQDTLASLDHRVAALESLARTLREGRSVTTETRTAEVADTVVTHTATVTRDVVDYGAVAFGLSEIRRKVADLVRGANVNSSADAMAREYAGAVQYFADVFAKADPAFDMDAFERQAGV